MSAYVGRVVVLAPAARAAEWNGLLAALDPDPQCGETLTVGFSADGAGPSTHLGAGVPVTAAGLAALQAMPEWEGEDVSVGVVRPDTDRVVEVALEYGLVQTETAD